ncbi:MAG: helix-turn-helix transcriptional regulator [Trueperaceae bacterium]|nr:helix-turn-helix transcriptional regulator [Trueperaceae bacterium]
MNTLNQSLNDETAISLAELFRTLGDSARIRILAALSDEEHNVSNLAALAGLSESATSHHLRHLRQMRLIKSRKEGRYVYYSLDDDHVKQLVSCGLEHVRHG